MHLLMDALDKATLAAEVLLLVTGAEQVENSGSTVAEQVENSGSTVADTSTYTGAGISEIDA